MRGSIASSFARPRWCRREAPRPARFSDCHTTSALICCRWLPLFLAQRGRCMDLFLAFVERSALAEWVRGSESLLAFPGIITVHAIGMAFLAGGSTAIDLRILGVAPGVSLNAISGTLLLIAYPTKALTNPLFYVKLGLIALGVTLVYRIGSTVLRAP